MVEDYKKVIISKGYWLNILLLLYPFLLISVYNFVYLNNPLLIRDFLKSACLNVFIISAILLASSIISHKPLFKVVFRVVLGWQYVCVFVSMYHFYLYKQFIGLPAVYAVLNSNLKEAIEFAANSYKIGYLFTSLTISIPLLYFIANPFDIPHHDGDSRRAYKLLPLILVLIIAVKSLNTNDGLYWTRNNPFFDIPKNIYTAINEKNKLKSLYTTVNIQVPPGVHCGTEKSTHILIIGESINSNHMSLYGYPRNTTPKLRLMADKLFVLKDPCSSRNSTIPALKELLTFANRENYAPLLTEPNLLQIMQAAGFKTYWLSNQQEVGPLDSFISIFSNCSDESEFVDRRGWADGMSLDEKLFEPFRHALAEKASKKFIVVHLIGAHHQYCLRYPDSYNVFKGLDGLNKNDFKVLSEPALRKYNQYDNAILYHDYVVHKLINMTNPLEPVTITYLSDHGEAVGDGNEFFGHAENVPYRSINEIPIFFYFSAPFKKKMGTKIGVLTENLSQPFQSDEMIHSLLDLYGIRYRSVRYDHSLFNSRFTPKHRYCDDIASKSE